GRRPGRHAAHHPARTHHPTGITGRGIHGSDPRHRRPRRDRCHHDRRRAGPVTAVPFVGAVTPARVLRSEWTKLRTLRSSLYCLAAAAAVLIGLAAAFAAADVSRWDQMSAQDRAQFDATGICLFGVYLAQLAIAVLGVLSASGEYGTGTIKATLIAVPR